MASWGSEKRKTQVTVEYIAVAEDVEEGEDGAGRGSGSGRMAHRKPRVMLTWHTYLLGLALL